MGSRRESFGWTSLTMTCQAQSQQDLMEVRPCALPKLELMSWMAQCCAHAADHHPCVQHASQLKAVIFS